MTADPQRGDPMTDRCECPACGARLAPTFAVLQENDRLRSLLADVTEGETAEEGSPQWYALRNARAELSDASREQGAS